MEIKKGRREKMLNLKDKIGKEELDKKSKNKMIKGKNQIKKRKNREEKRFKIKRKKIEIKIIR